LLLQSLILHNLRRFKISLKIKIISDQGTMAASNDNEISAVLETAISIQEEGLLSMVKEWCLIDHDSIISQLRKESVIERLVCDTCISSIRNEKLASKDAS
jgi:hypothetical protein